MSTEKRTIEYKEGSTVTLYLIVITMNEEGDEADWGGARLGDQGQIKIASGEVQAGDAKYAKFLSSE